MVCSSWSQLSYLRHTEQLWFLFNIIHLLDIIMHLLKCLIINNYKQNKCYATFEICLLVVDVSKAVTVTLTFSRPSTDVYSNCLVSSLFIFLSWLISQFLQTVITVNAVDPQTVLRLGVLTWTPCTLKSMYNFWHPQNLTIVPPQYLWRIDSRTPGDNKPMDAQSLI